MRVVGRGRYERLMQRLLPITPGVGLDADKLLVIADALAAERVQQLVLREPWLVGDQLYEVARVMRRLGARVQDGLLDPQAITPDMVAAELDRIVRYRHWEVLDYASKVEMLAAELN